MGGTTRTRSAKKRPGLLGRVLRMLLKGLVWGFILPVAYLAIAPRVSNYLSQGLYGKVLALEWPKRMAKGLGLRSDFVLDFWFVASYVAVGAFLGALWGFVKRRGTEEAD